MPTSSFYVIDCASLDYVHPATNYQNVAEVGDIDLGSGKTVLRRTLLDFNVETGPYSGRPLTPADTIIAAELRTYIRSLVAAGGWAARVERNARDDWRDDQATWNEYKTGSAWTAGGGDVDPVPAAVAYTSPAGAGEHVITGLAAYVVDAITYHAGAVRLRLKADDEAQHKHYGMVADPADSTRPRLVVTYTDPQVSETPVASPVRSPLPRPRGAPPEPASRPARPVRPQRGARP